MSVFEYSPATFIPFQDMDAVRRVRRIHREDITRHPNPDFRIQIMPDDDMEFFWIAELFYRVKTAADEGRRLVMLMPNPWPSYAKLAGLINRFRIDCRNLWTFNLDEYANEHGQTPPESWEFGFMHSFKKHFWQEIEPSFRPPERQILGPTTANIKDYGKMLADVGGADLCHCGPGWSGHLAFIEPDAPEFAGDLEQWKLMGPRICTLSPLTIAQNSMHGSFGGSGDLWAVPPKAATIGPAEVIAAKHRLDQHGIRVDGSRVSWQRLMTRLVLHGPVTPRLPQSILQTLRTDVWVAESAAQDIGPQWSVGY
jgi:glucosamine-6-phosphate deaminase